MYSSHPWYFNSLFPGYALETCICWKTLGSPGGNNYCQMLAYGARDSPVPSSNFWIIHHFRNTPIPNRDDSSLFSWTELRTFTGPYFHGKWDYCSLQEILHHSVVYLLLGIQPVRCYILLLILSFIDWIIWTGPPFCSLSLPFSLYLKMPNSKKE